MHSTFVFAIFSQVIFNRSQVLNENARNGFSSVLRHMPSDLYISFQKVEMKKKKKRLGSWLTTKFFFSVTHRRTFHLSSSVNLSEDLAIGFMSNGDETVAFHFVPLLLTIVCEICCYSSCAGWASIRECFFFKYGIYDYRRTVTRPSNINVSYSCFVPFSLVFHQKYKTFIVDLWLAVD